MYQPTNLKRWSTPDNYAGEHWPDYYSAGVGRSRDSDILEESNFETMLSELGGESETVIVVHEGHWAVGWVEWIAIHESDDAALETADRLRGRLNNYPILDEHDYSEREWNAAADYWDSQSPRAKVRYAMNIRKRYHWLKKTPVWPYGRLSYGDVANRGDTISEAIIESLRE